MTLILICNDDGIEAPGLLALVEAVRDLGRIIVCAPAGEQSGTSQSISYRKPLRVRRQTVAGLEGYAVYGTPADCVKLAMCEFVPEPPDLVLSGINAGPNWGQNMLYSGTVGAALEAAVLGTRGVALSHASQNDLMDFSAAGAVTRELVHWLIDHPFPPELCMNVTVPDLPRAQIRGFALARQGRNRMEEFFIRSEQTEHETVYTMDGRFVTWDVTDECDHRLVEQGYVTVTPMHTDLTAWPHVSRQGLEAWTDLFREWARR